MTFRELLEWQWYGYNQFHQSRTNLFIHIVAVPLFVLCTLASLIFLLQLNWLVAIANIVIAMLAMAIQGFGHSKEMNPANAFSSTGQASVRILSEQFITFPRFVITGGWYRAVRASAS